MGGAELWNRGYYIGIGGPTVGPGLPPKVEIRDAAGNAATELKVAKWHDAFEIVGGVKQVRGPDGNGHDFIDRDVDRFNVWVYDPAAWAAGQQTVLVGLTTRNETGYTIYDDSQTILELVRRPGTEVGWFWSDSQILVSNQVDDEYSDANVGVDESGPGQAVNEKAAGIFPVTDRTHRVALGGTVKASYIPYGMPTQIIADEDPVLVRRVVEVHPIVVQFTTDGGNISGTQSQDFIFKANEQYAQVGVRLRSLAAKIIDPGVDLSDGLEARNSMRQANSLTAEEESLFSAPNVRTPAGDDIELYFVNYFTSDIRGEAFPAFFTSNPTFVNSAIVSTRDMKRFTIAHEIGHILTNAGHYTGPNKEFNLMVGTTTTTDTVLSTKRFVVSQEALM